MLIAPHLNGDGLQPEATETAGITLANMCCRVIATIFISLMCVQKLLAEPTDAQRQQQRILDCRDQKEGCLNQCSQDNVDPAAVMYHRYGECRDNRCQPKYLECLWAADIPAGGRTLSSPPNKLRPEVGPQKSPPNATAKPLTKTEQDKNKKKVEPTK